MSGEKVMGKSEQVIEGVSHTPYVIEKTGHGPAHTTTLHKGGTEMEKPCPQSSKPVLKGL